MKKLFVIAALVLAAAVSCTKEFATDEVISVEVTPEGYVPVTLCANIDLGTKAEIKDSKVVWEVGEEVAVFADGAGSALKFKVSACDEGDTSVAVKIQGDVPEGTQTFVAAYPYALATACKDNVVTINIKAEQSIPEGSTYDPSAFASVAYFANAESQPVFRNALSIVKFNVGNTEGVEAVRIYYKGDVQSAGPIEVNAETVAITNKCDNFTTITAKGGFVPGTTYTAVVAPVAEASGVSAVAVMGNKASYRESGKESKLTLERNKGVNLGDVTESAAWGVYQITNVAELNEFLAGASALPKAWVATVMNDIDCSGAEIVAAASYAGIFDGQGYKLKNWTSDGVSLFTYNSGTIKGITLDKSCVLKFPKPTAQNFGFIVCSNDGTVQACRNDADIIADWGNETVAKIYAGTFVGNMADSKHSLIAACENHGNLSIEIAAMSAEPYIGLIAGRTGGTNGEVTVMGCVNTGNLSLKNNGAGKNTYVGGLFGAVNYGGIIEECSNSGSVTYNYVNGGTGSYINLGGVVGYTAAVIKNSTNTGAVTLTAGTANSTTRPNIGGVAGYVSGGLDNCHNKGNVSVSGRFGNTSTSSIPSSAGTMPYSSFGGVAGCLGHNTKTVECKDCSNSGHIVVEATQESSAGMRMGGIAGHFNASASNCVNTGAVEVKSAGTQIYAGGIGGYCGIHSDGELKWEKCINKAAVSLANIKPSTTFSYVGGIYGQCNKKFITEDSVNYGTVSSTSPSTVRVGGIGGCTKIIKNCQNYGNLSMVGATSGSTPTTDDGKNQAEIDYASAVGGITAFGQGDISGSTVKCSIVNESNPQTFVGGISGSLGNTAQNYYGNNVDVVITASEGVCAGWVLGGQIDNRSAVNFGTEDEPIVFESSCKINGEAVTKKALADKSQVVGYLEVESGNDTNITLVNVTGNGLPAVLTIERVWGKYPTEWPSFSNNLDRCATTDGEYVYVAKAGASAKGIWAISIADPSQVKEVCMDGVEDEGTFKTSCVRTIWDPSTKKYILLMSNLALEGGVHLYLYAYKDGIDQAPTKLLYDYTLPPWAERRFGDFFTVVGDWSNGYVFFRTNSDASTTARFKIVNGALASQTPDGFNYGYDASRGKGSFYQYSMDAKYGLLVTDSIGMFYDLNSTDGQDWVAPATTENMRRMFGITPFEFNGEKYIAYTKMKDDNAARSWFRIIKDKGTHDQFKASLEANEIVYQAAIQIAEEGQSTNVMEGATYSDQTSASCAVAVLDDCVYMIGHHHNVGLSVFKMYVE